MTPIEVIKTDYSRYEATVLSVDYMMARDGVVCDVSLKYTGQDTDWETVRKKLLKIKPPMIDGLAFYRRETQKIPSYTYGASFYIKWYYKEIVDTE